VDLLPDFDNAVRYQALHALGELESAALTNAGVLTDSCALVRHYALRLLGKIELVALTQVGSIVGLFADPVPGVRYAVSESLNKFEPAALTSYAGAIVGLFVDSDEWVRYVALESLGKLELVACTPYTGAIVGMLEDANQWVRYVALSLPASDEMGLLTPDVLVLACNVTNILIDADYYTRNMATIALDKLKRQCARLHWATARVYRARPYARFLHEYVGEQLCAPGGKWAERDRVALEAEERGVGVCGDRGFSMGVSNFFSWCLSNRK